MIASTACVGTAMAHEGDPAYIDLDYGALLYRPTSDLAASSPEAARLAYLIDRAGTVVSRYGDTLIPAGTTLDGCVEIAGLWNIDITFPADNPPALSETKIESIHTVFARAVDPERNSNGLLIRARLGKGDYLPLLDFIATASVPKEETVRETPLSTKTATAAAPAQFGLDGIAGPVSHGSEPVGALSGVTVFVSAGHGWTAGDTSWYLQRPLFLDMSEDYGNIDQLNYFVQYCYNAGATVVPFRPVGYQDIEIILDNDDPGVTYTGTWNNSTATSEYYENGATVSGVPYRWATAAATQSATARYTPTIVTTGSYPVYCWTRDGDDRVRQTYRIAHTGGISSMTIDHRMVGKGWIWLGNYYFEAGTSGYVEITNASPDSGVVIADAIRFGNGIGDIVRPGPGTISGYGRDEECSRYWAQKEAGERAVGMSSGIWDTSGDDSSDNVGTGARWGAVMNRQSVNNDRWRRIYMEFHSNAAGCTPAPCGAKGTIALVSTDPTTNQTAYATIVGDKVEADMLLLDDQFDYSWGTRSNPYTGTYGAISVYNNDNEFDATILEVAFHDNIEDTANLLDPRVRNAVARSTLYGMVQFLSGLPGSTVPLAFLPDVPENFRAIASGSTGVTLTWTAPPSGGASGDPATGYKIYRSTNGYGFDAGTAVGNVLTYTLTDVPADTTVYLRVTATNTGGESMPTETLAVRIPSNGLKRVLIVNGFDRLVRAEDVTETIPAGLMMRPIQPRQNSYDYIVQHASALDAYGVAFDSTCNEAVESGAVSLAPYQAVVWICGEQLWPYACFTATQQTLVTNYLNAGGRFFVSGAYLALDLDSQNHGRSFFQDVLGCQYTAGSSGTNRAEGVTGTITAGVATFDYGQDLIAPYKVSGANIIGPRPGATTVLNYRGRVLTPAGVAYDAGTYRTVAFNLPFESIQSPTTRDTLMTRIMDWLIAITGDFNNDGDVDLDDFAVFSVCFNGAANPPSTACPAGIDADFDNDGDVDLDDFATFAICFNGANKPAACP